MVSLKKNSIQKKAVKVEKEKTQIGKIENKLQGDRLKMNHINKSH